MVSKMIKNNKTVLFIPVEIKKERKKKHKIADNEVGVSEVHFSNDYIV